MFRSWPSHLALCGTRHRATRSSTENTPMKIWDHVGRCLLHRAVDLLPGDPDPDELAITYRQIMFLMAVETKL